MLASLLVDARPEHLAAVGEIYAEAARTSVATFDVDGVPESYWRDKLDAGDRFLVALADDATPSDDAAGSVLGFAYAGWFRPRPAYARTRETSIYLHRDARGAGLGRALYSALLEGLRDDGIHLAVAVVAQPNPASSALHEALGFEVVGTFDEVGHKFGRYVSTRWYQLRLNRAEAG